MARAWVYDRTKDKAYTEAVRKAKAAKRTPPARWLVRYYDPSGKIKSAGTYKKKPDTEKRQTEIENSLREGSYRARSTAKVTLGQMAEKWLTTRTDIKRSTWWQYRAVLDNHVLPRWGGRWRAAQQVRADRLKRSGQPCADPPAGLHGSTVQRGRCPAGGARGPWAAPGASGGGLRRSGGRTHRTDSEDGQAPYYASASLSGARTAAAPGRARPR